MGTINMSLKSEPRLLGQQGILHRTAFLQPRSLSGSEGSRWRGQPVSSRVCSYPRRADKPLTQQRVGQAASWDTRGACLLPAQNARVRAAQSLWAGYRNPEGHLEDRLPKKHTGHSDHNLEQLSPRSPCMFTPGGGVVVQEASRA